MRLRLLLFDDHLLFREGLTRLLETEDDFEVVAQCGTAPEALDALRRTEVDVVLLDYDLESDTGTRFLSAAHASGYRGKVLMVTAGMNELQCSLAWKLGISGIALKHSSPAKLLVAIRTVASGGKWNDQETIASVGDQSVRKTLGLTPRERQVLRVFLKDKPTRRSRITWARR